MSVKVEKENEIGPSFINTQFILRLGNHFLFYLFIYFKKRVYFNHMVGPETHLFFPVRVIIAKAGKKSPRMRVRQVHLHRAS